MWPREQHAAASTTAAAAALHVTWTWFHPLHGLTVQHHKCTWWLKQSIIPSSSNFVCCSLVVPSSSSF